MTRLRTIFACACSDEKALGHDGEGIRVERRQRSQHTINWEDERQVEEALQQLGLRLGAGGWISFPCADLISPFGNIVASIGTERFGRKTVRQEKDPHWTWSFFPWGPPTKVDNSEITDG